MTTLAEMTSELLDRSPSGPAFDALCTQIGALDATCPVCGDRPATVCAWANRHFPIVVVRGLDPKTARGMGMQCLGGFKEDGITPVGDIYWRDLNSATFETHGRPSRVLLAGGPQTATLEAAQRLFESDPS